MGDLRICIALDETMSIVVSMCSTYVLTCLLTYVNTRSTYVRMFCVEGGSKKVTYGKTIPTEHDYGVLGVI